MYDDAEEEREIGGIKGINQVSCRELGGRRRQYGPGSIIITTTRRSISILTRCSSFKLRVSGSLRSQIAVDNI
jgi:hypothetical protein